MLLKERNPHRWLDSIWLLEFQGPRVFVDPKTMTQNICCEKGFRHQWNRLNPICCFLKYATEHYKAWSFPQHILAKSVQQQHQ